MGDIADLISYGGYGPVDGEFDDEYYAPRCQYCRRTVFWEMTPNGMRPFTTLGRPHQCAAYRQHLRAQLKAAEKEAWGQYFSKSKKARNKEFAFMTKEQQLEVEVASLRNELASRDLMIASLKAEAEAATDAKNVMKKLLDRVIERTGVQLELPF